MNNYDKITTANQRSGVKKWIKPRRTDPKAANERDNVN